MKIVNMLLIALLAISLFAGCAEAENSDHVLWYTSPAQNWEKEALPIGNGRLGGMIYGGIDKEHIQFNEDTLWIGDEADTGSYQAFGDMFIQFGGDNIDECLSNPSRHATGSAESIEKTIDGNKGTKWCMEHRGKSVVWQMVCGSQAKQALQSYTLTSANDVPSRDPKKWKLEASNDGMDWTLLDERNLEKPFPNRNTAQKFDFENKRHFKVYRFTFEPVDKTHFQVAEIELGESGSAYRTLPGKDISDSTYRRELNIDRSVHRISYKKDGVNFSREYFASNPANVMVFRFGADKKAAYTGSISLKDAHDGSVTAKGNRITFSGALTGQYREPNKNYGISLEYEAQAIVLNDGGKLKVVGDKILFEKCDGLTIILAAGTDYINQRSNGWKGEHPHRQITTLLDKASKRSYKFLLDEHVDDYRGLFGRVELDLGESLDVAKLPTDKRLKTYKEQANDPELEALLFQYARYLMISSSRPGCMPANLQGLWSNSNAPPWRCDYHTDVNIQMNYWFVDQANLSECFEPLSEWLWSVIPVKSEITKAKYGTRGWMTRSENGIFGGSSYLWVPGDAAWVAQNIWDHYAFTQDKEYLRTRAYPITKGLCEFWEDYLLESDEGKLISPKSVSPEHGPLAEGNSYEQQLVWDLFTNFIEASKALGQGREFRRKVLSMKTRLLGPKIGKWGQLQEWAKDMDDPDDKHRHLSHLIAVHPGRQISPLTTPELAEAAKVSMNARGDGATGWSKAWKVNIWARLHDGNRAYKLLGEELRGNFYENLFGYHPPFQIDGNFGYASGVCEMLMQSHMGVIHLLPAIPDAWPDGEVKGLRARGNYEVDIAWSNGKLTKAVIRSKSGSVPKIRVADEEGDVVAGTDKRITLIQVD